MLINVNGDAVVECVTIYVLELLIQEKGIIPMEIKAFQQQVEEILGAPLLLIEMSKDEWEDEANTSKNSNSPTHEMIQTEDRYLWLWKIQDMIAYVFEMQTAKVTAKEAKFVELLLKSTELSVVKSSSSSKKDDETRNRRLGDWLSERIDTGELHLPIPDEWATTAKIKGRAIPLLLGGEGSEPLPGNEITYSKLNKLLRSYFGGEIVLIPLRKEWLILVREEMIPSLLEEREEGTSAERDMLRELCQGLQELISNEWVVGGSYHVSVSDPVGSDENLMEVIVSLRETMRVGRMFHVSEHIHLPWELQLERLVYSIPDEQRIPFIEVGSLTEKASSAWYRDEELISTLETFFQMDCNVSETAKRLYIHRNTLLYRLDKFKQETGLDVRNFRDAVLVQLKMLLYKVTK